MYKSVWDSSHSNLHVCILYGVTWQIIKGNTKEFELCNNEWITSNDRGKSGKKQIDRYTSTEQLKRKILDSKSSEEIIWE